MKKIKKTRKPKKMNTLKSHASIHIIYWITNVLFWVFSAAALFGIIMAIAILFNSFGNDLNLHVGLPTSFNVIEKGQLSIGESHTYVRLIEASGKINFVETPPQLRIIYSIFMFLIVGISYYLFLMFKRFVKNVYKGIAFNKSNIQLLKKISYGIVIFWVMLTTYTLIQYFIIARHLQFNSIEMSGNIEFYPWILIVALFLWVLSHIFMHGSQLEEEANLTI